MVKIIYSKKCLEFGQPGHPESPERIRSIYEHLKDDCEIVQPMAATEADILSVHTADLVQQVKSGRFYDADTPAYSDIFSYALLAAGGALTATELMLGGTLSMSLMRPPGHHAGKGFLGGFCYFNNVAIAVVRALNDIDRVAIIDFDCHHGNGTQDIFVGHDRVLYVSLHQSPLYPGTGFRSELNCLNYPVMAGSGEVEYLDELDRALDEVSDFEPGVVAVSAGFDTFKEDPLTNVVLDVGTYEKIGDRIKSLGKPILTVLEGGYSEKLAECVSSYLKGLER
ncbi:MAG: histone deacetylase family protein [Candidatus Zixiibacteriota bacterium]|nr:MAG: histone deacetylase family protein [candidate division Zixibacteria bacterium]